jgi:SSS family solute:Na+ symporter
MTEIRTILLIYFAVMMGTGIYSYFKIKTISDYFVSGKQGNWLQVTGSLLATILGGSAILGTVELSQRAGWAAVWFLGSASAGLFVLALIAPRVSRYGHYTLPEMIGRFYGTRAERTATILIPAAWLGVIAVQVIAGARIISSLGLADYRQGAILCGLVFIFYTLLGGQKSVLKTDLIQAIIILAGIILLFILNLLSDIGSEPLPASKEGLLNENFTLADLLILLITYSVTFTVGPDIYSRIFCARNEKTARISVILVAVLILPVAFMLTSLGMTSSISDGVAAGVNFPGITWLSPWVTGLMAVILLSAIMSSADTTLLSTSTILTQLVIRNLDGKHSLILTRIFIVLTGCISVFIAVRITSVLNAMLMALSFFSGAFILPVVAGIAGWKVNRKFITIAMVTGGLVSLSGKIIQEIIPGYLGYSIIFAAYVLNGLILFFPGRK